MLNVEELYDEYRVETVSASLLDVFTELNLKADIPIKNDEDIAFNKDNHINELISSFKINEVQAESDQTFTLNKQFNEEINTCPIKGKICADVSLEINIMIENKEIEMSYIVKDSIDGNLFISNSHENNLEIEKLLCEIKDIVILKAADVPIVISNELGMRLKGETIVKGDFDTDIIIKSNDENGFTYTSKDDSIVKIQKSDFIDGGVDLSTQYSMQGSVNGGIFLNIKSLLYDYGKTEIETGLNGKVSGTLDFSNGNIESEKQYKGHINASISPVFHGDIKVNYPFVDSNIKNYSLFDDELDPL